MKHKIYYIALLVLVVAMAVKHFASDRKQFYTNAGTVWTTEFHITYEANKDLSDSIKRVLDCVDSAANVYSDESLVSRFNAEGTVMADNILLRLMDISRRVNKESQGAFDPTVMRLVKAWKKARTDSTMLSQQQVDSLLMAVGIDKVKITDGKLTKQNPNTQLDFSAVAKGYACDEVGRMLERNGVTNYLVEIGGEVVAHGVNNRGAKWHVSVDLPTDQNTEISHESATIIAIDSAAVATSGNYRQFDTVDGRRITHIINPVTGMAEQSDLLSVTIVAPNCATADAWATACMVLGTERVMTMMQNRTDLGVMTISTDKNSNYVVWSNKTFAALIVK